MSNNTNTMLEKIKALQQNYSDTIIDAMQSYIYREKRYNTNFSVVMIYSTLSFEEMTSQLSSKLRYSDKILCSHQNLFCVIFDSVDADSYLKVAENLFEILKNINYPSNYYIATAFSKNFDENYLEMLNKLFERVEYSVVHEMSNIVDYEDFLI